MTKVVSSVDKEVGCPWEFCNVQIGLPATSIYGHSGYISGQPTTSKYDKVGTLVGSGVGCPWAAQDDNHAHVTAHYYGNGGQLSV